MLADIRHAPSTQSSTVIDGCMSISRLKPNYYSLLDELVVKGVEVVEVVSRVDTRVDKEDLEVQLVDGVLDEIAVEAISVAIVINSST